MGERIMPEVTRALHVGLSVRNMYRSADWYKLVLGFQFVREFSGQAMPVEHSPIRDLRHSSFVSFEDQTGSSSRCGSREFHIYPGRTPRSV